MRAIAVALVLALPVLVAGCIGGSGRYARYQDKGAALRKIDALVAKIPQYRGARLTMRQDSATSYKLGIDDYIEAEPYSSALYFDLPRTVTGATLQRYFHKVLGTRGWTCRFAHRSPGVPYGFTCTQRGALVGAYIADRGHYELDVVARSVRPPIPTVPGD